MSKSLAELTVGDQFMFNNELFEKIAPVKISCCRHATAMKVSDGANTVIKNNTQVEPVEKENNNV